MQLRKFLINENSKAGWWLLGAALFGASLAGLYIVFGSKAILSILVLVWLVPLAISDLRHRSIPHIAWVAVPCLLAALYAVWRGHWTLAAAAGLIVLASERHNLPQVRLRPVAFLIGLVGAVALTFMGDPESIPGGLGIIVFWVGYERGWMASVDSFAIFTLLLLWPKIELIIALGGAHYLTALAYHRLGLGGGETILPAIWLSPHRLSAGELEKHGRPGLPAIALAAAVFGLWHLLMGRIG